MNDVRIIRSMGRTSVTIRIMPDGSVRVAAPSFYPRFFIDRLLKEKEDWIKEKQQGVRLRVQKAKSLHTDGYLYLGKTYPLELGKNQKELIELRDKLYLGSSSKRYVKTYLTSWYKQQARKVIIERVHHYAKISGSKFNTIKITSAETRWGSCSSQKNLNFNWKLIMAPIEVVDYVVAHELAHLKEMNHSRDFWETVRKMFPLYREYRTWLKRNGDRLRV